MYLCWTVAALAVAGFGLSTAGWQLMIISLVINGLEASGTVAWATTKQVLVPAEMLGRVSSLDITFSELNELVWLLADGECTQTGGDGSKKTFPYRLTGVLANEGARWRWLLLAGSDPHRAAPEILPAGLRRAPHKC